MPRLKDYNKEKDKIKDIAQTVYNEAVKAGNKYPLIPVAQSILESGWYSKSSGKNNFFGQKASTKQAGSQVRTKEEIGGKLVSVTDKFRDYEDLGSSIQDHLKKWQPVYNNAQNIDEALSVLAPKYATASDYKNKLKQVIQSIGNRGIISSDIQQVGDDVRATLENMQPVSETPSSGVISIANSTPQQTGVQTEEEPVDTTMDILEDRVNKYNQVQSFFAQNNQQLTPQLQPQQVQQQQFVDPYSEITGQTIMQDGGRIIEDDMGQWSHPGEITKINSGNITMNGVNYPVLGIDNLGNQQMMYPNQNYQFEGNSVTEYPFMQKGGTIEVKDQNDPRYKAYLDSLSLYNKGREDREVFNSKIKKLGVPYELSNKKIQSSTPISPIMQTYVVNYGAYDGNNDGKYNYRLQPNSDFNVSDKIYDDIETLYQYKKPTQPVIVQQGNIPQVPRPNLQPVSQMSPEGVISPNFELNPDTSINTPVRIPKYWEIEDMIQGSTNYNSSQTQYRYDGSGDLPYMSPNNTRTITPVYQNGGAITVSDKNDPRYLAYRDSLAAYNFGQSVLGEALRTGKDSYGNSIDVASLRKISPSQALKEDISYYKKLNIPESVVRKQFIEQDVINRGTGKLNRADYLNKFNFANGNQSVGHATISHYKKPEQVYNYQQEPRQNYIPINLPNPNGLQESNFEIGADTNISPEARLARYWQIQDFIQGSTNYNGSDTTYTTTDPSQLPEMTPNNRRIITPTYRNGGLTLQQLLK